LKTKEIRGTKKFYKTNPSGISLIVLVITIIVIIILAAAVILTLNKNNPIEEASKARYESDVANMQAIFTNVVTKVMVQKQSTIEINAGELNSIKIGVSSTDGRVNYKLDNPQDDNKKEGIIIFNTGTNNATTYYTGRKLPLYSAGKTVWYVDSEGVISLKIDDKEYGNGQKEDKPAGEVDENEIVASDNPMLQSWESSLKIDFHAEEYRTKITKVKFAITDKMPGNKIAFWDVSNIKDKSVMAWIEDNGNEGYILTIAGKEKIVANENSRYLFYAFDTLEEIENIELLDTSNLKIASYMFAGCNSIINLDLSSFNLNNIKYMDSMFASCNNLINLKLPDINYKPDIGNAISFTNMFEGCKKILTTITIRFSSGVTYITTSNGMFKNAATEPGAKITVRYNLQEKYIDSLIATKSANSNIEKELIE